MTKKEMTSQEVAAAIRVFTAIGLETIVRMYMAIRTEWQEKGRPIWSFEFETVLRERLNRDVKEDYRIDSGL